MELRAPDDLHLHLRDGKPMQDVLQCMPHVVARAIVMPNLKPPVTTTAEALAYYERVVAAIPAGYQLQPLMTLYLTDKTSPDEINKAKESGKVFAVKLYPAGATTNSDSGVTDIGLVSKTLERMAEVGMPLLVHGEVTDRSIDLFDREAVFIERHLRPLVTAHPTLKVVMEHITSMQAVAFVKECGPNVAATITAHHLLYNRNVVFEGGLRPHKYCLPIIKGEEHRQALVGAIQSGSSKFFMGTDSAPHAKERKNADCCSAGIFTAHAALELYAKAFEEAGCLEHLEAFSSTHGAKFYGLPLNERKVKLVESTWEVPASYPFGDSVVVPLMAGESLRWKAKA